MPQGEHLVALCVVDDGDAQVSLYRGATPVPVTVVMVDRGRGYTDHEWDQARDLALQEVHPGLRPTISATFDARR